jgi:isoprenylcysteine carboxyl methyltransferase (ICMT) family protein YpbQ
MRRSSPDLLTWSGFVLYALSAAFLVAVIHLLGRVWTVKATDSERSRSC